MSTTIANLQHPNAGTADDNDDTSVSKQNSVEYSEAGPHRPRGDLVENAVRHGDNALRFLALGVFFAAGLLTFAVVSVALTAHGAPWAMPLGPIAAAFFAWFEFPSFRDHWRKSRAQMRAAIAEAAEWRSPQEELARAVDISDAALVRRVLSTPVADVNMDYDTYEPSLLFTATWTLCAHTRDRKDTVKALDTVRALLENGAQCDVTNRNGHAPMDAARQACSIAPDRVPGELIVLLQNAAEEQAKAKAKEWNTIVRRSKAADTQQQQQRRANVFALAADSCDEGTWSNVFGFVARCDDESEEEALNAFDSKGHTALHHAAGDRNFDLVRWLARRGATLRQRWNGEYDHINDDGDPVDGNGDVLDFSTPFDDCDYDDGLLESLTEAFEAGLREREGDQLRRAIDDMNRALPGRARKRL